MKLKRDSERVSPTGNVAPSGILNQLGRPAMDMAAVLVREAVQNSWDARRTEAASVLFELRGWVLSSAQRQVLTDQVFVDCPPEETLQLAALLFSAQDIDVLTVTDRGTTGLGGPTRADVISQPGTSRDFVNFLRDVGQSQQRQFAGGTYGYGKSIFYRISAVQTICVYTRCLTAHGPESRFTAVALGNTFIQDGVRYTGRHWWGEDRAGVVEPILHAEADALASALGLRLFSGDELGTTIVILQPRLVQSSVQEEPQTVEQMYRRMAECVLLYCWPKMLHDNGSEPLMRFAISWQGKSIAIPAPDHWPPLAGFVQAMQRLKAPQLQNSPLRHDVISIATQRPAKKLGQLALQHVLLAPSDTLEEGAFGHSLFANLSHHTALMRQPELIVTYIPGPAPINQYVGYTGVFLADADVDAVFAASEPPTHDAWVLEALHERSHRIFVNRTLEQIKDAMVRFARPQHTEPPATKLKPLGAFASMLGDSVLPTISGSTARASVWNELHSPKGATHEELKSSSSNNNAIDNIYKAVATSPIAQVDESRRSEDSTTSNKVDSLQMEVTSSVSSEKKARVGRASIRTLSNGTFIVVDGVRALQIPFIINHAHHTDGTIIHAIIGAVVDGDKLENEPPIGGNTPTVLRWIAPNGSMHTGVGIRAPRSLKGTWHVVVSMPTDIMVSIELRIIGKF